MKVLCIDATKNSGSFPDEPTLEEGETYSVYGETIGHDRFNDVGECYWLYEFSDLWCWEKWRFIPISNVDEIELFNKKFTELVEVNKTFK